MKKPRRNILQLDPDVARGLKRQRCSWQRMASEALRSWLVRRESGELEPDNGLNRLVITDAELAAWSADELKSPELDFSPAEIEAMLGSLDMPPAPDDSSPKKRKRESKKAPRG
ncbi:hypothetical protein V5F49_05080 [Xanthobacter sp. V3C-3]|uniref:hypothetical protein n=1 Tax=Xanthobacter lutulentifluminis TaxID=3119935 RepID=UPI00372B2FCF